MVYGLKRKHFNHWDEKEQRPVGETRTNYAVDIDVMIGISGQ